MVERKRIGIIFSQDENWVGGTYYFLNLIHALNTLESSQKPSVTIISPDEKDFNLVKEETNYPGLSWLNSYHKYSIPERIINRITRVLFSKQIITKTIRQNFDALFPCTWNDLYFSNIANHKKIYWIPDFQEDHYPEFFSEEEIRMRKEHQRVVSMGTQKIIFSSKDAEDDFKRLYPDSTCKTFVVHFAVTHPEYNTIDIKELLKKHQLSGPYFISPNQIWKHKNHRLIIEAVAFLKGRGIKCTVAFTGKEYDYRNPGWAEELKKEVIEKGLDDQILFLGFIDRKEQLQLMNHALAVIQPSLFEGWSTVIEDAKAMNQIVLASDIAVSREQLSINRIFFDSRNARELGEQMKTILLCRPLIKTMSYYRNIECFGKEFLKVTDENIIFED